MTRAQRIALNQHRRRQYAKDVVMLGFRRGARLERLCEGPVTSKGPDATVSVEIRGNLSEWQKVAPVTFRYFDPDALERMMLQDRPVS
jgi:hypothetical protein